MIAGQHPKFKQYIISGATLVAWKHCSHEGIVQQIDRMFESYDASHSSAGEPVPEIGALVLAMENLGYSVRIRGKSVVIRQ